LTNIDSNINLKTKTIIYYDGTVLHNARRLTPKHTAKNKEYLRRFVR